MSTLVVSLHLTRIGFVVFVPTANAPQPGLAVDVMFAPAPRVHLHVVEVGQFWLPDTA